MPKPLIGSTISQAEINQRSRESRRRLQNLEALLVPGIRATRSWVNRRPHYFSPANPAPLLSVTAVSSEDSTESKRADRNSARTEAIMSKPGGVRFRAEETPTPKRISRRVVTLGLIASAAAEGVLGGAVSRPSLAAASIPELAARVLAVGIPGASAVAQVGTFLTTSPCGSPIPTKFTSSIQSGSVLDPNRILVGSSSNFGAPVPASGGQQGSILSIDPKGAGTLNIPSNFATSGTQASTTRRRRSDVQREQPELA